MLNKILKLYQAKEIVVENLNFQNSELSPQLNRLLNRFEIKITYVNPAYTSQTCSNCGYIDKRNRWFLRLLLNF